MLGAPLMATLWGRPVCYQRLAAVRIVARPCCDAVKKVPAPALTQPTFSLCPLRKTLGETAPTAHPCGELVQKARTLWRCCGSRRDLFSICRSQRCAIAIWIRRFKKNGSKPTNRKHNNKRTCFFYRIITTGERRIPNAKKYRWTATPKRDIPKSKMF